jgi:hypothetical protein
MVNRPDSKPVPTQYNTTQERKYFHASSGIRNHYPSVRAMQHHALLKVIILYSVIVIYLRQIKLEIKLRDNHLHLVPRSKNSWSYTCTPQYAFWRGA